MFMSYSFYSLAKASSSLCRIKSTVKNIACVDYSNITKKSIYI